MFRIALIALLSSFLALTACTEKPASSSPNATNLLRTADHDTRPEDISPERITREVIGYTVDVTASDRKTPPVEWTFDVDEVRHVEILEREVTPEVATITVFMLTRSNPEAEQEVLELSGKLKLHYEPQGQGASWVLKKIENLTFHYSVGASIST